MNYAIHVSGQWASMSPWPGLDLTTLLTFLHPERQNIASFRQKRWDGTVCLVKDRRFPAGLARFVAERFTDKGHDVNVLSTRYSGTIDISRFTKNYLPTREMYEHQYEAALAAIRAETGIIRHPTGTGKGTIIAALARFLWEETGMSVLVVVPKKGLMLQSATEIHDLTGRDMPVGMLGDGRRQVHPITVATMQTLLSADVRCVKGKYTKPDKLVRDVVRNAGILIVDEVHHSGAAGLWNTVMSCPAAFRIGFSATPLKDSELSDMQVIGAIGPVIHTLPATVAMERQIIARPLICMVNSDHASGPELPHGYRRVRMNGQTTLEPVPLPYREAYDIGIVKNQAHNQAVVRAALWTWEHNRNTLVLCRRKEQWRYLKTAFEATGIPFVSVWGETDLASRNLAKKAFGGGTTSIALASEVWGEGEDIPNVEAVILAEGVKVVTNVLQRVGRGTRRKKRGANVVWVVDFVPRCHHTLADHAIQRCSHYEEQGYPVRVVEDWPAVGAESPNDLFPFEPWTREVSDVA